MIAFLLNALWQTAAIALAAIGVGAFLRPRARFALQSCALVACVAIAFISLLPHRAANTLVVDLPQPQRTSWIAVVYLIGLTVAAARLAMRSLRARRLLSSATVDASGVRAADVPSPLTIGTAIVLPVSLLESNDRRLIEAAIAHESAHVERRDYAVHVLLEGIALPLFFHPAMLALRRAVAHARELACDERAAARCGARAYAEALVEIAALAARRNHEPALAMAATSIEKRVRALIAPPRRRIPAWAGAGVLVTIAIACGRSSVEASSLSGNWLLDAKASDYRQVVPRSYDAFTQTIAHDGVRIVVRQNRVTGGRSTALTWSVITDGRERPVSGIPNRVGTASWSAGQLRMALHGPGAHRENVVAFVRGGRLLIDGQTERGRYHTEFVRKR
jgi:Zn-dependent protease with chaperone function